MLRRLHGIARPTCGTQARARHAGPGAMGFLWGLLAILAGGAAEAQSDTDCAPVSGSGGTVADAVDGDTLILADGRVVRLAGIEAPKPFLARPGADVEALAERARQALRGLAGGRTVTLRLGDPASDRHGRLVGHVYRDDGTWLQDAMVGAGLARVRPFAGDFSCLDDLWAREGAAREAGLGVWRDPEFSVISAYDSSLLQRKGLYVVVEGRVLSIGRGNRLDFLNFGRNWRSDFTVLVGAPISKRMAEVGLPIEAVAGKRVRVRGIVEESGGPAIRLADPSEIQVLFDD